MPKHNRKQKKKNRKNQKNKQHHTPNKQQKHNNKRNKNKNKNKNNNNNNRIKQVREINDDSDCIEITISSPTTPISSNRLHSPIKLHYFDDHHDADISDLDTTNHHNLSPIHHPIPTHFHDGGINKNPKMQILRSAKINRRDINNSNNSNHSSSDNNNDTRSIFGSSMPYLSKSQSNPYSNHTRFVSPGFNSKKISQHKLMPLSPLLPKTLHRASSEPLSLIQPRSILRSPSKSPSKSPTKSPMDTTPSLSGNDSNHNVAVSFGEVEVHEFKLLAGSESDGVPEELGYSLYLDDKQLNQRTLNIDEYEQKRYYRWTERAKHLHWNKKKMDKIIQDPEKYLFTAGRCDEFYSYLTPKEREQRLSIDKQWKKEHIEQLNKEKKELDKLRKSRKKNDIFCSCKPLSSMTTSELKDIAEQYDIKIHQHRKVKKGFLINQLKSKVLNYRDICCWDKLSCSCFKNGINCHSGTETRNFQCGCIKYHKKCANQHGRYMYKHPYYSQALINEWKEYYNNNHNKRETSQVSFKLS